MPKPYKRQRVVRVIVSIPADDPYSGEEELDAVTHWLRLNLPDECYIEEPLLPSYSVHNR